MPVAVGPTHPTLVNPVGWSSTANIIDTNDGTSAFVQQAGNVAAGTNTGFMEVGGWPVLTENGGPIPPGAILTAVSFSAQIQSQNTSTGLNLASTGATGFQVLRNDVSVASTTIEPGSRAANTNWTGTPVLSAPGSPQTTFVRNDFLLSNFGSGNPGVCCRFWGVKRASELSASVFVNYRAYYCKLTITYYVESLKSGGGAGIGMGGGLRTVTAIKPLAGPIIIAAGAATKQVPINKAASGGAAISFSSAPKKVEVDKYLLSGPPIPGDPLYPGDDLFPGGPIVKLPSGGAAQIADGSGVRKVESAENGGAAVIGMAAATKQSQVSKSGGAAEILSSGSAKQTVVIRVAAVGAAIAQGGGVKQPLITKALVGAAAIAFGSGAKKVEPRRSGGAAEILAALGTKKIQGTKNGGAAEIAFASATKKAGIIKPTYGAALLGVSGGTKKLVVVKALVGAALFEFGGGSKILTVDKDGGAAELLYALGVNIIRADKDGGAAEIIAARAENLLTVIKPVSGAVLEAIAFGVDRPRVTKGTTGGTMQGVAAGGTKQSQVDKDSGGVVNVRGDMLQYSLYTFGISGYTRDRNGTVVVASKVGLFRQDTWDRVAGPILSDPVTGRYAFTTPSPATLPVSYFVRMQKNSYAGGENIFGTTDEDLTPIATLVQGSEV